jgi:glyceraldehyde-3-phosphate dehydrogenase (NAD(P)+) (phosphorylating)
MAPVRVGVNGYGVIGKRVADAVRAQSDMELVGVSDVAGDYRPRTAAALGIPLYASTLEGRKLMEASGIPAAACCTSS